MPTTDGEREFFESALSELEDLLDAAMRCSASIQGAEDNFRNVEASVLYLRLCICSRSIVLLADNPTDPSESVHVLDHFSLASLARTAIETGVMYMYMTQPGLSEEEWEVRRLVMNLHDTVTRLRMFKSMGEKGQANEFRSGRTEIKRQLLAHPLFLKLPVERRTKILDGSEVYIHGLRSAVRAAEWDVDHFNYIYAYLSAHAHSSPVSFYRYEKHSIDFVTPSPLQLGLSAVAFTYTSQTLGSATKRLLQLYPTVISD